MAIVLTVKQYTIQNPVVEAIVRNSYSNYWTSTETYEALKVYIQMNFNGLCEKVVDIIAWESASVNTAKFSLWG